jgi:rSAM/selenodomain-associated transferase 1
VNRGAIVVFAKVPQAGQVKTRLVPPFSPEQAAEFQAAMLADVLAVTAEMARALRLTPVLAVHPWAKRGAVLRGAPREFRVVRQRGTDLAQRMAWAVREAAAAGSRRILLRGCDGPTLDGPAVSAALAALDAHDLVLIPDGDGGYGLVGLREPVPGLFAHAMSTRTVLEDTLANAAEAGLRAHVAAASFDIDSAADLALLAAARRGGAAALCPRALAFLDRNDLWPRDSGG